MRASTDPAGPSARDSQPMSMLLLAVGIRSSDRRPSEPEWSCHGRMPERQFRRNFAGGYLLRRAEFRAVIQWDGKGHRVPHPDPSDRLPAAIGAGRELISIGRTNEVDGRLPGWVLRLSPAIVATLGRTFACLGVFMVTSGFGTVQVRTSNRLCGRV